MNLHKTLSDSFAKNFLSPLRCEFSPPFTSEPVKKFTINEIRCDLWGFDLIAGLRPKACRISSHFSLRPTRSEPLALIADPAPSLHQELFFRSVVAGCTRFRPMISDEAAPFLKEPPLMIAIVGTALVTVAK
jgi:hypothetical protein